jgi:ComF family protein
LVNIWRKFVHFPRRCLLCGGSAGAAACCDACRAELPWNDCACDRCGTPLPTASPSSSATCGRCLRTPPPFEAALCAFHYRFPVDRLLVKLKFHGRLGYARELGLLLAEQIERRHGDRLPEAIVPVPLHPRRVRSRGFNQAAEIARAVGARLDLPVVTDICERRRDTEAQSSLSAAARQTNIRGAFSACGPLPAGRWAVVDVVVTPGATAGELARTLLAAGASSVLLWSPARA